MEKFEKVPLKELLEVIQHNLAFNIDSIYNQSLALIDSGLLGVKKEHNLGWKKENLKKQIEEYLKIVVKNIIQYINKKDDNEILIYKLCWQNDLIEMLTEAIQE